MTPDDDPPSKEGVPRPVDTGPVTSVSTTTPLPGLSGRARTRDTWFGENAPSRKFLSRWGFPLFVLIIAFLARKVLAPVVRWMSERKDGTRRMPRGLAIIICYIIFISAVVGFMFLLVPRLSRDVARVGKEAPDLYKKVNDEYVPSTARWLERRFPSLAEVKTAPEEQLPVADVPDPPGTAFTVTPLPDGRLALQLTPNGLDIKPLPDGGFHIHTLEAPPEPATLEDKLRGYVKKGIIGLQSKLNDVVRFGQAVVAGFIKGIFLFFFTLMIEIGRASCRERV